LVGGLEGFQGQQSVCVCHAVEQELMQTNADCLCLCDQPSGTVSCKNSGWRGSKTPREGRA